MESIKERRIAAQKALHEYLAQSNYLQIMRELTMECSEVGHVNLNTRTRSDGTQYYTCDNCNLQVELNQSE